MIRKGYAAIIAVLILGLVPIGFAQDKIGKTANLTLSASAQVGSAVLPAGNYEMQHLASPAGHFMEFTRVTEWNLGFEGSPTYYERAVVAVVRCNMETLTAKAGRTVIDKDGTRIARIEIKGENIAHIL